jgi:hypothetical protein
MFCFTHLIVVDNLIINDINRLEVVSGSDKEHYVNS